MIKVNKVKSLCVFLNAKTLSTVIGEYVNNVIPVKKKLSLLFMSVYTGKIFL